MLEPGDHGSTFAGGPVATAAALAVLDVVDDPALLRRVRELGAELREGLEALDGVAETRGRGLMVGVGLEEGIDAAAVGADLLERGLVVNVPGPDDPAAAAAADGRVRPGRAGGWPDRRIASRLSGAMSRAEADDITEQQRALRAEHRRAAGARSSRRPSAPP